MSAPVASTTLTVDGKRASGSAVVPRRAPEHIANDLQNCYTTPMSRPSRIRAALHTLILTSQRHDWTLEALVVAVQAMGVPATFSSVFRAMDRLTRDGVVQLVDLGDGKTRYEACQPHHEHLVCAQCGTVTGVPGCLLAETLPHVAATTGYVITAHHLRLTGLCPQCADPVTESS